MNSNIILALSIYFFVKALNFFAICDIISINVFIVKKNIVRMEVFIWITS